jgi:glycosyltransferase involved in cell wall biosynthesis
MKPLTFSIVTPSLNQGRYIEETIRSVLAQAGDFHIDYIVMDGGSTDETVEVIKKYDQLLKEGKWPVRCKGIRYRWVSERDRGMYDAVNKGFSMAAGDIFAYINSDDIYLQGAFDVVAKTFQGFPQIKWIKGITSYINESSTFYKAGRCLLYNRRWIQKGIYGRYAYFIQQDSVFWRRELWEATGKIDTDLKRAGDYYLWKNFAHHASLYSLKAYLSCFREASGQISSDHSAYMEEVARIASPSFLGKILSIYLTMERWIPYSLRSFCYRIFWWKQELNLIELKKNIEPTLRKASYYSI